MKPIYITLFIRQFMVPIIKCGFKIFWPYTLSLNTTNSGSFISRDIVRRCDREGKIIVKKEPGLWSNNLANRR